jgi:hypothetical protein
MKKWINLAFVLVLVFGLFLAGSNKSVSARPDEPTEPGLAPGDWVWTSADVVGVEVPMLGLLTKPVSWMQLITNGLLIKAPAKICHPFRGAQFGWSGSIYKLEGATWVKVPTTIGWEPSSEGKYMACAQAASAGTYALFGYWVKPMVEEDNSSSPAESVPCTGITMDAGMTGNQADFGPSIHITPHVSDPIQLTYVVTPTAGNDWTITPLSGSISYSSGTGYTLLGIPIGTNSFFKAIVRVQYVSLNCYVDVTYDW